MAEHRHTPKDPLPIFPANEAVIDGRNVTFTWEPAEGALDYRLEVSTDSTFNTTVLEETISGDVSFTVADRFPVDEEVYYWRVLARNEDGWSPGEIVESFVSGTPEEAALHFARPDEDSRMGPFPALIRSGGTGIKAELTGRQEYFDQEHAEGVEHEGVETGQIMMLAGAVLIVIVGIIGSVFLLYDNVAKTTRRVFTGISGYPELTQTRQEAEARLSDYGIIDEEGGVYQIPLDRAMELTIEEYGNRPPSALSPELPLLPGQQNGSARFGTGEDTLQGVTGPAQNGRE